MVYLLVMKAVLVYKDDSEHARQVIDFLREFTRRTGKNLETMEPETPAGISFCQTYDIVEYPSVVALDSGGQVLNIWKGLPLPQINEVSYYVE